MMHRHNGLMRTAIAVIVRVSVQCMRDDVDVKPEAFFLTGRNVRTQRIIEFFKLTHRDRSSRGCAFIEAEHRSLVQAAGFERSFGRVCLF